MPGLGMGGCDLTTDAARPPSLGADLVRTAARMNRSVACRSLETQPSIGGSVRDAARAPSLPDAMSAVLLQPLLAGGVPAYTVTAETAVHLMHVWTLLTAVSCGGRRVECWCLSAPRVPLEMVQCSVSADGLADAALLRSTCAGTSGQSRRPPSRLQRPQRCQ